MTDRIDPRAEAMCDEIVRRHNRNSVDEPPEDVLAPYIAALEQAREALAGHGHSLAHFAPQECQGCATVVAIDALKEGK